MELKDRYKLSEFGSIPNDWIECKFEDVMTGFSSGQTPYRAISSYYKGDIPWITSGELNYNVITDTIEKINIEGVRAANLKIIPKGTFLFAITGLEAAGTRGSCAITGIEATTNQSCMALYPIKDALTTPYLYQYYVRYGDELAFKYCQGTKQQSYTGGIAKKLPIILPPTVKEQTAIATALSDADALIANLEKLIEKKRNIKQGVMQQLLNPKEDWVEKSIFQLADSKKELFDDGDWIESEHITTDGIRLLQTGNIGIGKFVEKSEKKYIYTQSFEKLKCKEIVQGDLLICRLAEPAGRACILPNIGEEKIITSVDVTIFRPRSEVVNRVFLSYLFSTGQWLNAVSELCGGTTHKRISRGALGRIKVFIPPNIEEQNVIAKILFDLDAEITTFEQKLSKYKSIKQGMMQELLTGKIRLV
jgi:type I restriction enzyme S subunit